MPNDITTYNQRQSAKNKAICDLLRREINKSLPQAESKVWHGGPVWFLDGNPVAGYWVRKPAVHLMFWSGYSFDEPALRPIGNIKKFKAAAIDYSTKGEVNLKDLKRYLRKAKTIQWDYKNLIKRKGKLVRV